MEVVATQWRDVVSDPRYESFVQEIKVTHIFLTMIKNFITLGQFTLIRE